MNDQILINALSKAKADTKKNYMYVYWETKSTTTEMYNNKKTNFKTFEKIVNINIIETKRSYYHNTLRNYKNNMMTT